MKILVTGAQGRVGRAVIREAALRGHETVGTGRSNMDITRKEDVEAFFWRYRPQAVIHCAAYTAVDRAEEERGLCRDVNVGGTENIVRMCEKQDCPLIYLSTDYVFSGEGDKPYEVHDKAGPLNWYGITKWEGEQLVRKILTRYYIVRTSWLFGEDGSDFVEAMRKAAEGRGEIQVADDQTGSPTYTEDLAVLLLDMAEDQEGRYGIYHGTNEGFCSWYDFAQEIFRQSGLDVKARPISGEEYAKQYHKAARPQNSRLSKKCLTENNFERLPHYKDALKRCLLKRTAGRRN